MKLVNPHHSITTLSHTFSFYLEFPSIGGMTLVSMTICVYLCNVHCVWERERQGGRKVTLWRLAVGSGGLSADSLTEEAQASLAAQEI